MGAYWAKNPYVDDRVHPDVLEEKQREIDELTQERDEQDTAISNAVTLLKAAECDLKAEYEGMQARINQMIVLLERV